MKMFINYCPQMGISINSYRKPAAICGELSDVLEAIKKDSNHAYCCDLDGAADALCNGEYLSKIDVSQDTVEYLYETIKSYGNY